MMFSPYSRGQSGKFSTLLAGQSSNVGGDTRNWCVGTQSTLDLVTAAQALTSHLNLVQLFGLTLLMPLLTCEG